MHVYLLTTILSKAYSKLKVDVIIRIMLNLQPKETSLQSKPIMQDKWIPGTRYLHYLSFCACWNGTALIKLLYHVLTCTGNWARFFDIVRLACIINSTRNTSVCKNNSLDAWMRMRMKSATHTTWLSPFRRWCISSTTRKALVICEQKTLLWIYN